MHDYAAVYLLGVMTVDIVFDCNASNERALYYRRILQSPFLTACVTGAIGVGIGASIVNKDRLAAICNLFAVGIYAVCILPAYYWILNRSTGTINVLPARLVIWMLLSSNLYSVLSRDSASCCQ